MKKFNEWLKETNVSAAATPGQQQIPAGPTAAVARGLNKTIQGINKMSPTRTHRLQTLAPVLNSLGYSRSKKSHILADINKLLQDEKWGLQENSSQNTDQDYLLDQDDQQTSLQPSSFQQPDAGVNQGH